METGVGGGGGGAIAQKVSGAELSVNMHIKSDLSAGGILSLAEE